MPCTSRVTVMEVLSCCLLCFVCFFCFCFSSARRCLQLNTSLNEGGCVVYQGPNQTNQDLIKAWLKHEEPNSTKGRTRQQQKVVNQIPSSSPSEYTRNTERLATFKTRILIDKSNAGRKLSDLGRVINIKSKRCNM